MKAGQFNFPALTICSLALLTASAFAQPLIVDQFNGPYYTISEALAAATPNSTIMVMPGLYVE